MPEYFERGYSGAFLYLSGSVGVFKSIDDFQLFI